MKHLVLLSVLAINLSYAQILTPRTAEADVSITEAGPDTTVYLTVDKMPEIVGGMKALAEKIVYPELAVNAGIEGIVYIAAEVNENGWVKKTEIMKSAGDILDNAALATLTRVKFTPGEKDGKKVKVKITVPIAFRLDGKSKAKKEALQDASDEAKKKEYLKQVDVMPEIEGGMAALAKNIVYPAEAKENKIEGKVFVTAIIDENGNATEIKVLKGIGYGLDESAADAVRKTKFIPGKDKGKNVKVQITIPIMYKLQ